MSQNSKPTFLQRLGNVLVPAVANLLAKSLKIEIENAEVLNELKKNNQNFIIAFWHGKMFAGWFVFGGENSSALVSKSNDGEILARTLKKWGYNVVRGSSHTGGKEALKKMEELLRKGFSLSITPDGPTGPAKEMKAGAIVLSKKTNVPVILAGICYEKKRVFNSWDKFELPAFFSRVKIRISEPFVVPSELSYEDTNGLISEKSEELNKLNEEICKN